LIEFEGGFAKQQQKQIRKNNIIFWISVSRSPPSWLRSRPFLFFDKVICFPTMNETKFVQWHNIFVAVPIALGLARWFCEKITKIRCRCRCSDVKIYA
jgi:hypothetical protein